MKLNQLQQQINLLQANMRKMQVDYKQALGMGNKPLASHCVKKYWDFSKNYQQKIKLHEAYRKLNTEERKRFSGNSSVPTAIQQQQRHSHAKDIIQPREQGELNPEFIKQYGFKGLRVTKEDVDQLDKKSRKDTGLGKDFREKVVEEALKQDKAIEKR